MSTLPVGMKGVKNKEISYQDVKSQPLELLDSPNVLDYKIERLVRHFWEASDIACLQKNKWSGSSFPNVPPNVGLHRGATNRLPALWNPVWHPASLYTGGQQSNPMKTKNFTPHCSEMWQPILKKASSFVNKLQPTFAHFGLAALQRHGMIQYWVQVKIKWLKIVSTFFSTVRSWWPCHGSRLPIWWQRWGVRCLVRVATGAILRVTLGE